MKVKDIMTQPVECVSPAATLQEIAKMMNSRDIGSVPVCEGEQLMGLVTDRDIVVRAIATGMKPESTMARDIMSIEVQGISSDADVHEAARRMSEYQIRRLPVVDHGKIVGMIALGDLAVENIHIDEAGDALSDISQGVHH